MAMLGLNCRKISLVQSARKIFVIKFLANRPSFVTMFPHEFRPCRGLGSGRKSSSFALTERVSNWGLNFQWRQLFPTGIISQKMMKNSDAKLQSRSTVVVQVHGNKTSKYDGQLIKSHMQRERAYMWNIYESFSVTQVVMAIYKSGQQITQIGFPPTSLLPSLHITKIQWTNSASSLSLKIQSSKLCKNRAFSSGSLNIIITMTSDFTPLSSLNLSELDLLAMNTPQLAIASYLYPNLLHPRHLTAKHIAAIRININNHFANLPSSTLLKNNTGRNHDPVALIRQAMAYGQYLSTLETAQPGPSTTRESFFSHFMDVTKGMNLFEAADVVGNWNFIERLKHEGEPAQREVLEKGWTAYEQVPEYVKRDLRDGSGNVLLARYYLSAPIDSTFPRNQIIQPEEDRKGLSIEERGDVQGGEDVRGGELE